MRVNTIPATAPREARITIRLLELRAREVMGYHQFSRKSRKATRRALIAAANRCIKGASS